MKRQEKNILRLQDVAKEMSQEIKVICGGDVSTAELFDLPEDIFSQEITTDGAISSLNKVTLSRVLEVANTIMKYKGLKGYTTEQIDLRNPAYLVNSFRIILATFLARYVKKELSDFYMPVKNVINIIDTATKKYNTRQFVALGLTLEKEEIKSWKHQ